MRLASKFKIPHCVKSGWEGWRDGGHETLQEDAVPLAHDVRARAGHMSGTYILFSRSHDDFSRV